MTGTKDEIFDYLNQTLEQGKRYTVEISTPRTGEQNKRWQKILNILSEHSGHTKPEIQAFLTADIWGEPRHTSQLTTVEMAILIDRGQQLEAELGIYDEI